MYQIFVRYFKTIRFDCIELPENKLQINRRIHKIFNNMVM